MQQLLVRKLTLPQPKPGQSYCLAVFRCSS